MREALSKLIANMVYLGATEEEIVKVIRMSKELIDYEKKYGARSVSASPIYPKTVDYSPWVDITTATNNTD